jgi:hypothetical protein
MENAAEYHDLATRSFGEYTQRLNWKTSARRVHELLGSIVG